MRVSTDPCPKVLFREAYRGTSEGPETAKVCVCVDVASDVHFAFTFFLLAIEDMRVNAQPAMMFFF